MKLSASLVTFALLAISASASPTPGQGKNHDDRKWYNVGKWKGGDKWDDSGKWYDGGKQRRFTSTFSVKATPDQVVNGTEPTGGLPVSLLCYLPSSAQQLIFEV
jgi:ABC-type phosphonate transport system ATPase subunit